MIIVLLGVAIIVSFIRFYIRGIEPSPFMRDFKLVYTACVAFAKGENPYNRIDLEKVWQNIPDKEKIVAGSILSSGPFMYTPFVLLLFQPTVVIKWNIAKYLMLIRIDVLKLPNNLYLNKQNIKSKPTIMF